ncbi:MULTISPECIES: aromatic/alkene monooxygenase hydroxylase subunit beta [unclassified Acinetobacter]|uniref:aromatic/alkene monooxygenase hydroxylase subunit beta n=1 Tax=unclassified Acinetobacter TaxID=196816 RepID=UPI002574A18D|nr:MULTISPECIES: aromatic/alkene monooxygenase hydroxylase subunit beta [unclassified Acinetobacter]MDM1764549.1 phenol hydroxylase [Acinetobacter sp. 226-1]MDM1767524.1 phenol hydroxylase [Acinetobacter sp. 226-4]
MTLEIKTSNVAPIRQTYAYIERRFGHKPATRYQEVSFDIQGAANFHYRPLWNPSKTLNDPSYTALHMQDWYVFKDPRQFYYGAYVQHRARLQDVAESNYAFFEKRHLVENISDEIKQKIITCLLPFRYVEQTANLHMMSGSAYGYGTVITQACMFAAMDRLGMAQYISRIGLLLDGNTGESLQQAKNAWMNDAAWQPLRKLCELSLTEQDWFKLFVLQNLLIDSLMQSLVYGQFDQLLVENGARDVAMLTEFMQDCLTDLRKWSDPVFKLAIAESEENKALIQNWVAELLPQVQEAFGAWATLALNDTEIEQGLAVIAERSKKAGLADIFNIA